MVYVFSIFLGCVFTNLKIDLGAKNLSFKLSFSLTKKTPSNGVAKWFQKKVSNLEISRESTVRNFCDYSKMFGAELALAHNMKVVEN